MRAVESSSTNIERKWTSTSSASTPSAPLTESLQTYQELVLGSIICAHVLMYLTRQPTNRSLLMFRRSQISTRFAMFDLEQISSLHINFLLFPCEKYGTPSLTIYVSVSDGVQSVSFQLTNDNRIQLSKCQV